MIDCSSLTGRKRHICQGSDDNGIPLEIDVQKRFEYLKIWFPNVSSEEIMLYLQKNNHDESKWTGLGDAVASAIKFVTFGKVKPCKSCKERQKYLNNLVPFTQGGNVDKIIIDNPVRNFLMHIWPTKNSDSWKWNCDQVLKRQSLFNGKRVIGIAVGENTESAETVKKYMSSFTDDFIVVNNIPRIREGATFIDLLKKVNSLGDNDFTFYCHAKGVRHGSAFESNGSTLRRWTETMYIKCLDDWNSVSKSLEKKAMTGCFKRYGNFKTPGNNRWHYSGSFYWFRNKDVFTRNWPKIDNMFFAVESWPGRMFTAEETDCLFLDNCGDLYKMDYWEGSVQTFI